MWISEVFRSIFSRASMSEDAAARSNGGKAVVGAANGGDDFSLRRRRGSTVSQRIDG
jgi:hypothetical protein